MAREFATEQRRRLADTVAKLYGSTSVYSRGPCADLSMNWLDYMMHWGASAISTLGLLWIAILLSLK
jgi:hypothetical protein